MTFAPSIALDAVETARIREMAERYLGEKRIAPFAREVARALRRAGKGRRVGVVDFTTPADRAASRIQIGVVVDGRPDHGLIFGAVAREGASHDN